jgi:hypothetical protein
MIEAKDPLFFLKGLDNALQWRSGFVRRMQDPLSRISQWLGSFCYTSINAGMPIHQSKTYIQHAIYPLIVCNIIMFQVNYKYYKNLLVPEVITSLN